MSLLFGAVVRSIGNTTRDFPFNWIVFESVSYNLRASHSPIVLKIQIRNFSLAATGIITEMRASLHYQGRDSLPCSLISTNNAQCNSRYTYFFDEYNSITKLSFKHIYYLV